MSTSTVYKTSISIKNSNWEKIKDEKNKSSIINKALDLFYHHREYLEKANQVYWENLAEEWLNDIKSWNTITLNPNNEKITRKMIKDKLWF